MINPHFEEFKQRLSNPFRFRLFMLTQLPSAWFAGLKIEKLTYSEASISVSYKWFNKNPFRSIYVAVLSMPSEVSTGILSMGALYKRQPTVSMLVVKSEGSLYKKATGKIVFTCSDGARLHDAVEQAITSGEAVEVRCHTTGLNEAGELAAEFYFTWSFKARRQ